MPRLTIDGKQVTVAEGTTVLQACEQAGSPVPFYCYHPGLSIAGNCRICLVEIAGMPKLQIACYTRAAEGMVISTTSDKALIGRRDVLEFLLINHPLDCPVCDQAGECWLQDYYMEHGLYDPKFNEQKVKKPKAVPVGPHVMLDAERCILCSRCVRFCDEITRTSEFGIFNRSDHSEIGIYPGKEVKNNYSGCVVDICPVGALTDRDFRFKCRVWYLGSTKSICPGCSMGCNIEIHDNRERKDRPHVAQGARVMRLKPRYNPEVNQWWMCDEGRYGYKLIDENRIAHPQVRHAGQLQETTWEEALDVVASSIRKLQENPGHIGVLLSTHLTNEELFLAKRLFSELLKVPHVTAKTPLRLGCSDEFLMKADKSPNTRGAQALGLWEIDGTHIIEQACQGNLRLLYSCGCDLIELFGEGQGTRAIKNTELFVYQGGNQNHSSELAHVVLPSAVYAEKDGTFTNCQSRVQRIRPAFPPLGESHPDSQIFHDLADRLGIALPYRGAEATFDALVTSNPAFHGLSYELIGDHGALLESSDVG